MFAKFVKKQNKNGIKIIRAPVGEVENNWLKNQFYHHSDHVLKNLDKHWRNGTPLTIDEKKERLWHLIRDVQKYAYSKGYQTGYERGLVKAQQIKKEMKK